MRRSTRVAVLAADSVTRASFTAMIGAAPGLELVAAAPSGAGLWRCVMRTSPEVVAVDCWEELLDPSRETECDPSPPALVLSSGPPDEALVLRAALAGAGAVLPRSAPASELLAAVRALVAAPRTVPEISDRMRVAAAAGLERHDCSIVALRLTGSTPSEIATALGTELPATHARLAEIITRLEPDRGSRQAPPASLPGAIDAGRPWAPAVA